MGIADLIQVVSQSRKTGALVLSSDGLDARLYYRKGNLVDARSGENRGMDVLVRIIDWTGGEFEFKPGVETDTSSLDMDVHRAVMTAAKLRDERKMEEAQRMREENERAAQACDPAMVEQLRQLISMAEFVRHVSVLDAEGRLVGEAFGSGTAPDGLRNLSLNLHSFAKQYPRAEMKRVVIEDEAGTVALARMPEDRSLVLVADRAASLGVVCVTLGKLLASLTSR